MSPSRVDSGGLWLLTKRREVAAKWADKREWNCSWIFICYITVPKVIADPYRIHTLVDVVLLDQLRQFGTLGDKVQRTSRRDLISYPREV